MTYYRTGKTGMLIAAATAAAMCVLSFVFQPERPLPAQTGLCLPSPGEWHLPVLWSWIINTSLLGLITIGAWLLNRTFNFIRSTEPVMPALFLLLTSSNPWITGELSSSLIICSVNLIWITILFTAYDSKNATQPLFAVATFISIGSMFQYAFLPMGLAALIGALIMKVLRFKELATFLLGLISPYWIALGFGWIKFSEFRLPEPLPLFSGSYDGTTLFLLMLSVGVAIFIGVMTGFAVGLRLYAGNSKVNAMNGVITWTGIISVICILIDFNNIFAYLATLYLAVAVQLANLCALWQFRHEWLVTFLPGTVFVTFFILMLLL